MRFRLILHVPSTLAYTEVKVSGCLAIPFSLPHKLVTKQFVELLLVCLLFLHSFTHLIQVVLVDGISAVAAFHVDL